MKIIVSLFIIFFSSNAFSLNPFLPECKMLGNNVISFAHCNYSMEDDEGTFEGEANDGFLTGLATIKYNDGETYRGTLFDGKFAGYGRLEFPNGDLLVGDMLELFKEGITVTKTFKSVTKLSIPRTDQGVMLINDSQIYVGGLKNGKFHGVGLWYILKDENEFNEDKFMFGEWEEHKLKVDYKTEIKECDFDLNGKIIDEFCFLFEAYEDIILTGIYEYDELKLGFQRFLTPGTEGLELGYFKNNVLDGYGFSSTDLTYTKYHFGNFKDGTANGYGIAVTPELFHYGEFKNNLRDGFGYFEKDDMKIMGIYREDKAKGYFETEYSDGRFIAAQYIDGKADGLGYYFGENDAYVGEFKNYKYDGYGVKYFGADFSYYNEDYQVGLFKEDEFMEALVFCKKLFGDYYTNPKLEGCSGNDNEATLKDFLLDKNNGLGDRWLEEYYKKERIKFD